MESVSIALRNSGLTEQDASLRRLLSTEDSSRLLAAMDSLVRRYPSQDQEEAIAEYFQDFEQLCLKYSLPIFLAALSALRIKAGQSFFPRPDEVAEEIDTQLNAERAVRQAHRQTQQRQTEIKQFWKWALEWMEATGFDEEELLRRWPSYRETRPPAMESAA